MAFLVTVHERVAPGAEPNHPQGVYEFTHEPLPFKTLKELKLAVRNYGPHTPFTYGIVQGIAKRS